MISSPRTVNDSDQAQNNTGFFQELVKQAGQDIDVTTTVGAGTEFAVAHGLQRKPNNVILYVTDTQSDAYLALKPGGTAWTTTNIYLKCNTATATFRARVLL